LSGEGDGEEEQEGNASQGHTGWARVLHEGEQNRCAQCHQLAQWCGVPGFGSRKGEGVGGERWQWGQVQGRQEEGVVRKEEKVQ
jgi:hypothetical protein